MVTKRIFCQTIILSEKTSPPLDGTVVYRRISAGRTVLFLKKKIAAIGWHCGYEEDFCQTIIVTEKTSPPLGGIVVKESGIQLKRTHASAVVSIKSASSSSLSAIRYAAK